jgi:hypothetical protein
MKAWKDSGGDRYSLGTSRDVGYTMVGPVLLTKT